MITAPDTFVAYVLGILVGVATMVASRWVGPKVTVALATYRGRGKVDDDGRS